MTDLSSMRDRPIGTPGVGFSAKRAEVDEEGRQKFLEDVRAVLDRPLAVGMPGAYLIQTNEIQPSGGYAKMVSELPPGYAALDPLGFAPFGITKAKAFSQVRKGLVGFEKRLVERGVPRAAARAHAEVALEDIRDMFGKTPEGLWDRIEATFQLRTSLSTLRRGVYTKTLEV